MYYGEKYLDHVYSADRIQGEWFNLDNQQVMADVASIFQTPQPAMAS